jgi:glutamine amidotransferase
VGFNQVRINNQSKLYSNFNSNMLDFYFTHSYRMHIDSDNYFISTCNYQNDFVASFEFENITGTQFHPELSQTNGLKLLKNFLNKF